MAIIAYEIRLAEAPPAELPADAAPRGRTLATGQTRHVFVSRDFQRVRLPRKYRAMFGIADTER